MRIVRVETSGGEVCYGVQRGDAVFLAHGDPFSGLGSTDERIEVKRTLAPVVPTCIYAIGLNYRQHAAEMGAPLPDYPVVFMKSPGAIQDPGAPIVLPRFLASDQVDAEAELAVVIGRRCKNVRAENALEYVAGYTCANDVSARDWQKQWGGGQWCRAKSFDTFCPLGPTLVTPGELDPEWVRIRGRHNGTIVQEASTGDLIFSIPELIAFLSGSTTLMPGTVLLTGTPSGVGMAAHPPRFLQAGDRYQVEIDGIGALENPVELEDIG